MAGLGAAARENLAPILGRHTRAKAMPPFAHLHTGLVSSFHNLPLKISFSLKRFSRSAFFFAL